MIILHEVTTAKKFNDISIKISCSFNYRVILININTLSHYIT